ncbi:hypothetical protein ABOM_009867 [Aspergillus bombycis]|uniref:Uncharacterized protein n=1 Tax=Aspergillus bombycis TaxID=109264 RepID=A0A1F7ZP00_9EURO|nr:hypothetical protein ABOM_009867 [Aspergillus bombycis]OGM41174.1 hypothetical protein ABOM_009867 [Aspergillus bombycis]
MSLGDSGSMAITAVIPSHEEKRLREFYQIVYLLSSLDLRRGDRIKKGISAEQEWITVAEHRRNMADALAYISAYDKTPGRVTAVALGKEKGKLVVWIAANQKVRPEVEPFLKKLFKRLDQIAHGPELGCDRLVNFVLRFNWKGVQKYYTKFHDSWATYYESQQSTGHNHSILQKLDIWVQGTSPKDPKNLQQKSMVNLARKCHKDRNRDGGVFDLLKKASTQGIMSSDVCERLCNLLLKIGKPITLCRKLIDARKSLPEDFENGAVVKPIHVSPRPSDGTERNYSFDSITDRIFPTESEKQTFYHHVNQFYDRDVASEKLQTYVNSHPRFRVHAEIQLISYFDTNHSPLLEEGNPYIGCSKPACYLCYKYITHHPRQWFQPPSHQKLYPHWGLPEPRGEEKREEFLATTAEVLQRELEEDITKERGPRSACDDSTAGVTSVPRTGGMKREESANPRLTSNKDMVAGNAVIVSRRALRAVIGGVEGIGKPDHHADYTDDDDADDDADDADDDADDDDDDDDDDEGGVRLR